MINLKQVLYHKIGNHLNTQDVIFKVYLASIDPHFYFSVYIVPFKDTFKMSYSPEVDNINDNGVIEFSDDAREYAYGENIEIIVANDQIDGYGDILKLSFSIDSKPIAVNSDSMSFPDFLESRQYTKDKVSALQEIGLHTLYNTVQIEVEAKLYSVMGAYRGVNQNNAIDSIVKNILVTKKIFISSLPEGMSSHLKEYVYDMFSRIYNTSPVSHNIVNIFTDGVMFGRMIHAEQIDISVIPYGIRYVLSHRWMRYQSRDAVQKLKTAAAGVVKTETFSLNISTSEDTSTLYEVIQKTQNFVYINKITLTNDNSGETKVFNIDNELSENYSKMSDSCDEIRGIPSTDGTVLIQYSYGSGCDNFIGIKTIDNAGDVRGISREDNITETGYEATRIWKWRQDEIIKRGTEVDDTESITFEFTGV
jgi:hypothetical protein